MRIIKVLLLVLSITLLVGCETTPDDIVFDRLDFSYVGVTSDDYLYFKSGNHKLELLLEEDGNLRASYEKYQDIYLIIGTKEDYQIRKNGSLIQICTGEDVVCSGFETAEFSKDVDVLFEVFEEKTVSISMIILGVLVVTAAVSLFFVPKQFLGKLKLKNIKIRQLLILRIITILMIGIGVMIIVLSI